MRIDWDSSGVWGDADGLEPDSFDARTSSGRHEQMIAAKLPSILHVADRIAWLPVSGKLP
jgi:hypothetical protein